MVSPHSTDDPDPAKVNYRSMGRGHGGVLTKRRPRYVRDFSKPVHSTIPAKFETVLYRDNCEKKGFGLHTPRFVDQHAEQRPGPGSYAGPSLQNGIGALQNQQVGGSSASGSVGLRGNNAFATRAPRLPRPGLQGAPPGPGAYEAEAPAHDSARPSASFAVPGSVNPLKFYARPSPGPGDYADGSHAWSARGPSRPTNVCISQAGVKADGRLELAGEAGDGPGPGQYDTASPRASSLPPKGWTIGSSKRRLVPHASDVVEPPIQNLLKAGAEIIADKTPDVLPGPGDYDPQTSEAGPRHTSTRGLSSFQSGLSHLPRSWRPPSPGPGEYAAAAAAEPAAGPARAVFASASPRFREKAPRAPGPAYYKPRTSAPAQSFHLNLKGSWV